jgi:hypothetical protein
MIIYYVVGRLWLVRVGVGGYGASTEARPIQKPNI